MRDSPAAADVLVLAYLLQLSAAAGGSARFAGVPHQALRASFPRGKLRYVSLSCPFIRYVSQSFVPVARSTFPWGKVADAVPRKAADG